MGHVNSSFHPYEDDAETAAALLDILDELNDDEQLDSPEPEYVPNMSRITVMAHAGAIVNGAWGLISESVIAESESWLSDTEGLAQARSKLTVLHSSLMTVKGLTCHGYDDLVEVAVEVEPRSSTADVSVLLAPLINPRPERQVAVRVSLVLSGEIAAQGIVDEFGVADLQIPYVSTISPQAMSFVWEYSVLSRAD